MSPFLSWPCRLDLVNNLDEKASSESQTLHHDIIFINFFIGVGVLENAGASGPFAMRTFLTLLELRLPSSRALSVSQQFSLRVYKEGQGIKAPALFLGVTSFT